MCRARCGRGVVEAGWSAARWTFMPHSRLTEKIGRGRKKEVFEQGGSVGGWLHVVWCGLHCRVGVRVVVCLRGNKCILRHTTSAHEAQRPTPPVVTSSSQAPPSPLPNSTIPARASSLPPSTLTGCSTHGTPRTRPAETGRHKNHWCWTRSPRRARRPPAGTTPPSRWAAGPAQTTPPTRSPPPAQRRPWGGSLGSRRTRCQTQTRRRRWSRGWGTEVVGGREG